MTDFVWQSAGGVRWVSCVCPSTSTVQVPAFAGNAHRSQLWSLGIGRCHSCAHWHFMERGQRGRWPLTGSVTYTCSTGGLTLPMESHPCVPGRHLPRMSQAPRRAPECQCLWSLFLTAFLSPRPLGTECSGLASLATCSRKLASYLLPLPREDEAGRDERE